MRAVPCFLSSCRFFHFSFVAGVAQLLVLRYVLTRAGVIPEGLVEDSHESVNESGLRLLSLRRDVLYACQSLAVVPITARCRYLSTALSVLTCRALGGCCWNYGVQQTCAVTATALYWNIWSCNST